MKIRIDTTYVGLRNQILNLKASDIGIELDDNSQIYASVVDMPIGKDIVSLICVIDGTVSMYYSSGGGNDRTWTRIPRY